MRIVPVCGDLCCIDILVLRTVQVECNCYCGWEVEVAVQCARPVSRFDRDCCAELPHIVGTGCRPIQAGLDAIALVLDLGERQIYFCYYPGNIEPSGVADASVVFSSQTRTDASKAVVIATMQKAASGEVEESWYNDKEFHV